MKAHGGRLGRLQSSIEQLHGPMCAEGIQAGWARDERGEGGLESIKAGGECLEVRGAIEVQQPWRLVARAIVQSLRLVAAVEVLVSDLGQCRHVVLPFKQRALVQPSVEMDACLPVPRATGQLAHEL
jgi:hypothetical protein